MPTGLPLQSYWLPTIMGVGKNGGVQAEWRKGALSFVTMVNHEGLAMLADEPSLKLEHCDTITDKQLRRCPLPRPNMNN